MALDYGATKVIGTSLSGHTAAEVDYLCDGADDQQEFTAALAALTGGGMIVVREGTYTLTDRIAVAQANIIITGMGAATVIKRGYDETDTGGMIHVTGAACSVRQMAFDGTVATYASDFDNCVFLGGAKCSALSLSCDQTANGIIAAANDCNISDCRLNNATGYGVELSACSGCTVTGCQGTGNGVGIALNNAVNCTCAGNTFNGNNTGIRLGGGSTDCTVTGNTASGNSLAGVVVEDGNECNVSANTAKNNTTYSIRLEDGVQNNLIGVNQTFGMDVSDNSGNTTNIIGSVGGGGGASGPELSDDNPAMDGAVAPGVSAKASRADHVHPHDTTKVNVTGGAMTGDLTLQNNTAYSASRARNISYGTADMTAGTSALASGAIYMVYE